MVHLSWNTDSQSIRNVAYTQSIAEPIMAEGLEVDLEIKVAKVAMDIQAKEGTLLMVLMFLTHIKVSQRKSGRPWAPTVVVLQSCKCENIPVVEVAAMDMPWTWTRPRA
jgi:hypothetical protein